MYEEERIQDKLKSKYEKLVRLTKRKGLTVHPKAAEIFWEEVSVYADSGDNPLEAKWVRKKELLLSKSLYVFRIKYPEYMNNEETVLAKQKDKNAKTKSNKGNAKTKLKKNKVQVGFRLNQELLRQLDEFAKTNQKKKVEVLEEALLRHFQEIE